MQGMELVSKTDAPIMLKPIFTTSTPTSVAVIAVATSMDPFVQTLTDYGPSAVDP